MSTPEIKSKGFTIFLPVKEDKPNTITWKGEGGLERKVTYLVKSSMGIFQRMRMDDKLWVPIGKNKEVFINNNEWEKLTDDEKEKLTDFFETTFHQAVKTAKKVHVETPEFGREVPEKEAKRIKALVKDKLAEMIAAARSSPKHTSKMEVSHNVGVIRCETTEAGGVKIFAAKGAGKGSFLTAKKMVDFGSVEKIVVGNKAYAYLKLHDLKRLSPKAAKARIEVLKQEIATLHDFADKGVKNMMKLIEVKYEVRKIGKAEVEVPVGIMVEWCNLGDAEWITKAPPKPKTQEYIDCVFIARDVAVGVASLHANETVQGDLKPANILLSTRGGHISAVVGDPGSCVKVGQSLPSYSPAYAAPEMLEEGGEEQGIATKQSDVWSFGVSLLEMFHGEGSNEFATISSPEQMEEAHDKIIARLNMDNDIDALIYDCLQASSSRPTMQEVVDRLNAILSKSPPSQPQKPLSSKAQAQLEARTEQRFIDWKRQAKEVEVVAT